MTEHVYGRYPRHAAGFGAYRAATEEVPHRVTHVIRIDNMLVCDACTYPVAAPGTTWAAAMFHPECLYCRRPREEHVESKPWKGYTVRYCPTTGLTPEDVAS